MQAGAQSERVEIAGALRDAAFTGLIAFGLFLPLIGLQTGVNGSNELILTTRWPFFFALVAIIAAGRFSYAFALAPWLDVFCPGCGTSQAIDLRKVNRHPFASVATLVLGLRCSWCRGGANAEDPRFARAPARGEGRGVESMIRRPFRTRAKT